MTDLTRLSLKALRDGIAAKEFTALEATDSYISAIEAGNDKLNAYVAVTADQARDMAKASDAKIASGDNGMLEGVPLNMVTPI
ncbi:MAG: amidase family protein, partial [Alphaproteobacteria bacterium]